MPGSLMGIANGAIAICLRLPFQLTVTHTFASFRFDGNTLNKRAVASHKGGQHYLILLRPLPACYSPAEPRAFFLSQRPLRGGFMSTSSTQFSAFTPKSIGWSIALSVLLILAG